MNPRFYVQYDEAWLECKQDRYQAQWQSAPGTWESFAVIILMSWTARQRSTEHREWGREGKRKINTVQKPNTFRSIERVNEVTMARKVKLEAQ